MKALDSKIASWLKPLVTRNATAAAREKATSGYFELRRRIANPQLATLIDQLKATLEAPASDAVTPEAWLQTISEFHNIGYNRSAHTVAISRAAELATLVLSKVAPFLPDQESVEAWRKHAKRPMPDLGRELLQDPKAAYEQATADWLLAHGTPSTLPPLLRHFLERQARPTFLKAWDESLRSFLLKDPKAERLVAAFEAAGNESALLNNLTSAIRGSPKAMLAVAKTLGILAARREVSFPGSAFVRGLFFDIHNTAGKNRRQTCAAIAVLGGNLLLAEHLSPAGEEILGVVADIGKELSNLTRSSSLRNDTWALQPLVAQELEDDDCLTPNGARRWAIVYERALQEGQPVAALEVLGYNLGLREIGSAGQKVSYSPREHEDMESGILPGELVQIVGPGWAFQQRPIIRARVRRAKQN